MTECRTCWGSRIITIPSKTVFKRVNQLDRDDLHYTSVIGGVDACPTCTARAEAEYFTIKKFGDGGGEE